MMPHVLSHTPGCPTALHPTAVPLRAWCPACDGARFACSAAPSRNVCLQPGSATHIHPGGLIPSNTLVHHEINSQEGAVITFHLPLHKYVEIKAAHSAEPTNTRR